MTEEDYSDSMEGTSRKHGDVPTMEELVEEVKAQDAKRDRTGSDLGLAV